MVTKYPYSPKLLVNFKWTENSQLQFGHSDLIQTCLEWFCLLPSLFLILSSVLSSFCITFFLSPLQVKALCIKMVAGHNHGDSCMVTSVTLRPNPMIATKSSSSQQTQVATTLTRQVFTAYKAFWAKSFQWHCTVHKCYISIVIIVKSQVESDALVKLLTFSK